MILYLSGHPRGIPGKGVRDKGADRRADASAEGDGGGAIYGCSEGRARGRGWPGQLYHFRAEMPSLCGAEFSGGPCSDAPFDQEELLG